MPFGESIVALSTPAGESAIAVVRVSGSICHQLVTKVFDSPSPCPRKAVLAEYIDLEGKSVDQVVYIFYAENASYTGEEMLEINCHGNPFIIQNMIEDLLARGCRIAEPGEFTKTAFLSGRMDLSQAEAVLDLIHACSEKALEVARKQLDGSVGNKVNQLIDKLLGMIANLEAYIDFPEEDLPTEDKSGPLKELVTLRVEMERLISTSHYSTILHEGVKVVIVGPTNAGKSSLLNALTGEDRVIVSQEPGTTRDFVEEPIMLGSYIIRLIDTAGFQKPGSDIERMGIDKSMGQLEQADFVLVTLDGTLPCPPKLLELQNKLKPGRALIIENKIDLPNRQDHRQTFPQFPHCEASALTGEGIDELKKQLLETLETNLEVPGEDRIVVSARHAGAFKMAQKGLDEALRKLPKGEAIELVVSDLRSSLHSLGEIIGKIDNERMLDKLFSKFCIGK